MGNNFKELLAYTRSRQKDIEAEYTEKEKAYKRASVLFKRNGSRDSLMPISADVHQYTINTKNGLVICTIDKSKAGHTITTYEGLWDYPIASNKVVQRYAELTSDFYIDSTGSRKINNTLVYRRSWKHQEKYSKKSGIIYYIGNKEPQPFNSKRANAAYNYFELKCKPTINSLENVDDNTTTISLN